MARKGTREFQKYMQPQITSGGRLGASRPTPKGLLGWLVALFALAPALASASEGNVVLHFSGLDRGLLVGALVIGLISIGVALAIRNAVMKADPGSEAMREVGKAIYDGALAYLKKQVATMAYFVAALAIALFFLFFKSVGPAVAAEISICFIVGVSASYATGFTGMLMAVCANVRTASAALTSYRRALETAFRAGAVTGLLTVGLGLSGASLIFLLAGAAAMKLLIGFGFGGSLAALFMRVGGGIFTKAADVGADLVGKVEAGIPEDDARNPATIADNVGDNVGDCAGMAADVFESYSVMLVAAIVLGAATAEVFDERTWLRLVLFTLVICALGILSSIFGIFRVAGSDDLAADPLRLIRRGFYAATGGAIVLIGVAAFVFLGGVPKLGGVATSRLVSIDQAQRDELVAMLAVRDKLARTTGKAKADFKPEELAADPAAKALGWSDDETRAVAGEAATIDEDTLQPLPDVSDYRRIDFNSDDPILKTTVQTVPMSPNESAEVKSLGDAYGAGEPGHRSQMPLAVFDLRITRPPSGAAGQPPQPPLNEEIGPGPVKAIEDEIDKAKAAGTQIEVLHTFPVYFYANSDGALMFGAEGLKEPMRLNQVPLSYYDRSPAEVEKAKALLSNPQQELPGTKKAAFGELVVAPVAWWLFLIPVVFGVLLAFAIEQLTDYYVSTRRKPTMEVAKVANAGPAPMILQGFSYGLESSAFMVGAIVLALIVPLLVFPPGAYGGSYVLSFFGVALVGLGLLTTTGFVLAMDTFGPISDNAQGVVEMSGEGKGNEYGRTAVAHLDAAGNTTKALTKGFAITTAVVAAVALFHSYLEGTHLAHIGLRLDLPTIFFGLLIGGAAPFLFAAFSINAVNRAAYELIDNVRAQFRNEPGIMTGKVKPNYAACVEIVTAAAQRELLAPGILAIMLPVTVGFGFSIGQAATKIGAHYYELAGAQALGGFLAGAILSGQLMAVLLANSGGIWDNAKKLVEDGLHGGKGTDAHHASIVGDTVGDPFKDTAGPALNPLIKVMNLISLLLAPVIVMPVSDGVSATVAGVGVVALVFSLAMSRRARPAKALD